MDGQNLKLISNTVNSQVYLYTTKAGKFALKYVPSTNKQQILHLSNQAKILSALDHDFIVKSFKYQQKLNLHGKKQNSQFRDFGDVLVMEYAPKGNLLNFIQQNKLSLSQIKTLFKNISQAVKHIHVKGYSHRDLKLENILVFQQNNKLIPKLADFGFASYCYKQGEYIKFNNYRGTPKSYMAPQIDNVKKNNSQSYDAMKSDIFSLGVIMFALVLGRLPFEYATKTDKIYSMIAEEKFDEFWKRHEGRLQKLGEEFTPQEVQKFKDLFIRMVSYNPQSRPTISQILDNSWLSI